MLDDSDMSDRKPMALPDALVSDATPMVLGLVAVVVGACGTVGDSS
jgi:hypothetical protein